MYLYYSLFAHNTFTLCITGPQTHSRRATGCWCYPPLCHGNLCRLHLCIISLSSPSPLSATLILAPERPPPPPPKLGTEPSDAMLFCLCPHALLTSFFVAN